MASKQAAKRLTKEYQAIQKEPPPFVFSKPNESNVLEWHFILRGPPDTPYFGGEYYGVILFPPDYPFAPPGIKVNTPSGRFSPGAAICTSMSNFHPGSWNPAWSVQTILTGLLSFMLAEEITTGSIRATEAERKTLAAASHIWNIAQPKFRSIFPEYAQLAMKDLPDMGVPKPSSSSSSSSSSTTDLTSAPTTVPRVPPTVNQKPTLTRGSTGEVARRGPDRPPGGMSARRWIGWAVLLLAVSWATVKLLNS